MGAKRPLRLVCQKTDTVNLIEESLNKTKSPDFVSSKYRISKLEIWKIQWEPENAVKGIQHLSAVRLFVISWTSNLLNQLLSEMNLFILHNLCVSCSLDYLK